MKDINATIIVDLKPSEREISENLHKDARWGVNRAIREGLIVEEAGKEEDWNEFYEIYKKIIFEGGANMEKLEELKENSVVLFICKKQGKIIAGAVLKIEDNKPVLYLNASLAEFQKYQPNNLLYWKCIVWSKKKGYKELDLGGWQIKARGHLQGINKFKEKWGKLIYYKEDYPFLKALGRKLIRNSSLFWWINKKLRGRK